MIDFKDISKDQAIADFAEFISPGKVKSCELLGAMAVPARREGVRVRDADGESYVNCRSSGGVFKLGHCPAECREINARVM